MIYSTGYQRLSIAGLINTIVARYIDVIVDVRSVPYSRRPDMYEYNKNRLQERFDHERFPMLVTRYLWKGEVLGGKYGEAKEEGITWLIGQQAVSTIILLCMEDNPLNCHRHYDIARRLLLKGIDVIHLYQCEEKPESQFDKEDPNG
jgi:uncharacterized protein (DUF488 family)